MIQINNVSKKYWKNVILDNISFSIEDNESLALIGPNSSGKTTLISILTTLKYASMGSIIYTNKKQRYDVEKDGKFVRGMISLAFQEPCLDPDLTVYKNLYIHSMIYYYNNIDRVNAVKRVIKEFELEKEQNKKIKILSGGMKKRVDLARALLNLPKYLFLDEPSLGLDPAAKHKLWTFIKNIQKKHQTTLIICTNSMEEAKALCKRAIFIEKGKIKKIFFITKKTMSDKKFIELKEDE